MRPFFRNFEEIKYLLRLALPVLSANVFGALMEICDTCMASKTGADIDLIVVSKISAFWFPLLFLLQNILLNTLPLIVRFRGAGEVEKIRETFWNGVWLAAGLSLFSFLILSVAPYLFSNLLIGNHADFHHMHAIIIQYCQILRWGCPAFFLFSIFKSLADGASKTIIGTNIGFLGLCCNILFNWMFVYGNLGAPCLGGLGCAISTVLSYWIMSTFFLFTFCFGSTNYQLLLGAKVFHIQCPNRLILLSQFLQGGINGLVHFIETAAFNAAIFFLDGYQADSTVEVASIRITSNVADLLYLLPLSIGIATTIRIGGLLGQGERAEKLHRSKNASLFLGIFVAIFNCFTLILFRFKIAEFVHTCPKIRKLTSVLLTYAAIYQLPEAIQVICFGILRAYQKLFTLLSLNFFSYWIIAMPLGVILGLTTWLTPRPLGAVGFWIALFLGLSCAAVLSFLHVTRLLDQPLSSPCKSSRFIDETVKE